MKQLTQFDFEIYSHFKPNLLTRVWNKIKKHENEILAVIAVVTVMAMVSVLFLSIMIKALR